MLTHIEYPTQLQDIVIVGYKGPRVRSFTLRPRLHGDYQFYIWPARFPDSPWVVHHDLSFATQSTPPVQLLFDLDQHRPADALEWEWALVRPSHARERLSVSDMMFGDRRIASGTVAFADRLAPDEVRTVIWSCNQPFDTEGEQAVLHPYMGQILPWYKQLVEQFNPHTIWGAGDTAYSDGTKATNFADQVYDQEGWHLSEANRQWLKQAYRRMYWYHWSFPELQDVMRSYPHLLTWDDHEIHDGWGSEETDFEEANVAMFRVARSVAEEYVLNVGPRLRQSGDAHQAYVLGPQASFIFDSRSSRNYAKPDGQVISPAQLEDFRRFCSRVAETPTVEFLIVGSTVPLIYLKSFLVMLGSRAPKVLTDLAAGVRDDMRDSWDSPGNQESLTQLLDALKDIQWRRPDIQIVVVAGDIHVANAFEIWPPGFPRPFYHVTSSAITNRDHAPDLLSVLAQLDRVETHPELGLIRRLWDEITDPNVLCIRTTAGKAEITLKVLPLDESKATDQTLELS